MEDDGTLFRWNSLRSIREVDAGTTAYVLLPFTHVGPARNKIKSVRIKFYEDQIGYCLDKISNHIEIFLTHDIMSGLI